MKVIAFSLIFLLGSLSAQELDSTPLKAEAQKEVVQEVESVDLNAGTTEKTPDSSIETPSKSEISGQKSVETPPSSEGPVAETSEASNKGSTEVRSNPYASVLLDVAPLSMWIPFKFGGTLSWYFQNNLSVDFSILKSSINLDDAGIKGVGDTSENRIDLVARKTLGTSFNFFGGYSYQKIKTGLTGKVRTDNPGLPFYDTQIKAHTITAGVGNRWVFRSGFTWGVDWVAVSLPISTSVSNDIRKIDLSKFGKSEDKKDISDAMDKLEKLPRLTLLHFKLGWSF